MSRPSSRWPPLDHWLLFAFFAVLFTEIFLLTWLSAGPPAWLVRYGAAPLVILGVLVLRLRRGTGRG